MKKVLKTFFGLAVVLSLCLSAMPLNTFAAGSATIGFSKQNVSVGDTVTVSVTVSVADMYAINLSGSYNEEVLTYVSGASQGGAGIFQIVEELSGEGSKSFSITFKAAKSGSASVSVKGQAGAGVPPVDVDVAASANLVVKDVTLSNNANLKYLRPSSGSLSPRFSQNVTEYTVNVKKNVTECKLYADTADANAKVSVSGSATLKIGENKRVVTVTAPSGAQKSYTVTIIRSDVDEPAESSSNTSSTAEVPSALETIIGGVSYIVMPDITGVTLPQGFNVSKRLYNNEEVSVAIDAKENFELFYLKEAGSDNIAPYTYDSEKNAFTKVIIITQYNKSYIVAPIPEELYLPEEFTTKNVKIKDIKVKAYLSPDNALKDMYYIYCYIDGEYSMYRYDTVEDVLQRSPEISLENTESKPTGGMNIELLNRFGKLSSNAKTIVVCLLVAFVGMIVLLVLIIVKLIKRGKAEDFDLEDAAAEEFKTVKFDDDFEIISEDDKE